MVKFAVLKTNRELYFLPIRCLTFQRSWLCFILFISMLLLPSILAGAAEFRLDRLLAEQDKLWQLSPQGFITQCGWSKFKWNSAKHDSLYYSIVEGDKVLLGKLPIVEIVARFNENRLQRVEFSLYNRGDLGELSVDEFDQKLATIKNYLNQLFHYNSTDTPKKLRKRLARSMIFHSIWENKFSEVKLRWSLSKSRNTDRPEFIALYLYLHDAITPSTRATVNKKTLPERIKTDQTGGKYLELPMVDQGSKGYCVVAVLERVLKYYGSDIDQHILAELVSTSAEKGTSYKAMVSSLREADHKLRVKFKPIYQNREMINYSKFMLLLKRYNKLARRAKKSRVKIADFMITKGNITTYYPEKFFQVADPQIYIDLRLKYARSENKRFFRDIEKNIMAGIPILWTVQLGIFPEQGKKQQSGGHMRLIIGFNRKTKTIFYSDSWGRGHELKKMPYRQAWAMTTGIYIMLPRFQR